MLRVRVPSASFLSLYKSLAWFLDPPLKDHPQGVSRIKKDSILNTLSLFYFHLHLESSETFLVILDYYFLNAA